MCTWTMTGGLNLIPTKALLFGLSLGVCAGSRFLCIAVRTSSRESLSKQCCGDLGNLSAQTVCCGKRRLLSRLCCVFPKWADPQNKFGWSGGRAVFPKPSQPSVLLGTDGNGNEQGTLRRSLNLVSQSPFESLRRSPVTAGPTYFTDRLASLDYDSPTVQPMPRALRIMPPRLRRRWCDPKHGYGSCKWAHCWWWCTMPTPQALLPFAVCLLRHPTYAYYAHCPCPCSAC